MLSPTDDDFGPFVGPLHLPPSDPEDNNKPHNNFLATAKANTDKNRRAVLDELLAHQDDPLYWHKPSHSTLAPPVATTPFVHSSPPDSHIPSSSSSSSSSSWFATLHERIPSSTHSPRPFTRSFFAPQHAATAPPSSITPSSTFKSSSAPFAPHVFVPISGAPGFKPDEYDWDRGFSAELEHEAITSGMAAQQGKEQELLDVFNTPPKTESPGSVNLGEYIEKKSGSVELTGRKLSTVPVLNGMIADKIRSHLPALSRLPRTWSLIYSLDQHGISLKTLYTKCEAATAAAVRSRTKLHGMVFVVKDSDGGVFGTWIGDGLRISKGNEGYYGSGESFLWKWLSDEEELKAYKWTGRNDYVALCDPESISFGGGDGSYGLYLDDTLYEGTSARSITFHNDVLCSSTGPRLAGGAVGFECVGVEVWGIG